MIGSALDLLQGNILAVDTGEQKTAAVFLQQAVNRKQHAAGVRTSQNTAVFVGFHMDHIVQRRIFALKGNTKIFKQTQAEAILCVRLVGDLDLAALGHHHTQVLFQLFRCKINGMVCP